MGWYPKFIITFIVSYVHITYQCTLSIQVYFLLIHLGKAILLLTNLFDFPNSIINTCGELAGCNRLNPLMFTWWLISYTLNYRNHFGRVSVENSSHMGCFYKFFPFSVCQDVTSSSSGALLKLKVEKYEKATLSSSYWMSGFILLPNEV